MTTREFYSAIASSTVLPTEVVEFASAAIAKMDAANNKRRNTPSKTALANAPLIKQIVDEILSDTPVTAMEVAERLGVSTQKASALLRQITAEGIAEQGEGKVTGKGTVKMYVLASDADEDDEDEDEEESSEE